MKHLPTIARYLLGLIFLVFGLNFWLKFIPLPSPEEGSLAAGFMDAIYLSGFLTVVKGLEVLGAILLLGGRYVNLALAILGPIVVVIGLYHLFILKGGYPMAIVLGLLSLTALAGRRDFITSLFNPR
jgi:putative oxidoreductase